MNVGELKKILNHISDDLEVDFEHTTRSTNSGKATYSATGEYYHKFDKVHDPDARLSIVFKGEPQ